MKIAHLCLSCFYIDGHSYQENLLVQQNIKDGHDVKVIASTESFDNKGNIIFLDPMMYAGVDGADVYRVAYNKNILKKFQSKIRSYEGVFEILKNFQPDVIYFHGLSAFELLTIAKYKKIYSNVKIILDCHSDKYNSALTLSSKILHRCIYKPIFNRMVSCVDRIFCVSLETIDFAIDYYNAPKNKVEFYPLGGECLDDKTYHEKRYIERENLNISNDKVVILQTGKMNKNKKLIESLMEFNKLKDDRFVYLIAGSLDSTIENEALNIINQDMRIKYLGWVNSDKMQNILCASDIYIQPGTQSATMQQSLCLRNSVILADFKSHKPFVNDNGWLIKDPSEISTILFNISKKTDIISKMSQKSYEISLEMLAYEKLANKIYTV